MLASSTSTNPRHRNRGSSSSSSSSEAVKPRGLFQRLHRSENQSYYGDTAVTTAATNHSIGQQASTTIKKSRFKSAKSLGAPFRRRTESVTTVMSAGSLRGEDDVQATAAVLPPPPSPVILGEWLQGGGCPADVLPLILAFCGPQQTAALSKTNRHWNAVIRSEGTWRILCEELYKWKIGDPEPDSWFELYRSSPCVPVDYPSIPKALSIALDASPSRALRRHTTNCPRQVRSVRVLLRPGKYYLRQAVDVLAIQGVTVTLETMEMPKNIYRPVRRFAEIMEQALPLNNESPPSSPKRSPSFRNLFNCLRQENTETTDSDDTDLTDDWIEHNGLFSQPPKHATLILRSRRHNEPVFRIRQGVLNLNNLEVQHDSHGLDIWNGNAAVQIQPPLGEDELPIAVVPRPTAVLERVQISSKSGRGIVNIDGGQLTLRQCAVTNCAATGVYIGGQHSHATIEQSDVIRNGIGNRNTRRGIARGHSGIYLEQGAACIRHSNVSSNTLTGISVVSPDNATLTLEDSTLFSNGSYQLELPPPGTASRQRSVMNNNVLAERGELRLRSGLTLSEPIARPLPPPLPYHALQLQFAHPLPNY